MQFRNQTFRDIHVTLTTERKHDILIMRLEGRIDALSAADFESRLFQALDEGARNILLDFSRCDFINSNGLRILLMARKRLAVSGEAIAICALQQHIRNVFEIAGFTMLFPVFATEDEAVGHFPARPSPAA
jgi:anti-anti-sigma factor